MIELLIEKGAEINYAGPNKITPLHRAVMRNNVELIKLMLGFGADIHIEDKDGLDALNLAVGFGNY